MTRRCFDLRNIFKFLFNGSQVFGHTTGVKKKCTNQLLSRVNKSWRFRNPHHVSLRTLSVLSHEKQALSFRGRLIIGVGLWFKSNLNVREDVEDNLAHLVTLARLALERGEVERAEAILEMGVKLSEEHHVYTGLPFIYDILATIALSQGNVSKAENLLVTAIEKLTLLGFPDDHYNIVDFKLRLARIYSATGENNLAKIGFDTCLRQQQNKILNGDTSDRTGLLYINVLFWYGVHKIRNDSYTEARTMINTAYEYSTKIKGLTPKQEMVILYTLADLNAELGDYDTALASMLNAVMLGKGIGSVDMPVCFLKLGTIYEKMGFIQEAREAYQEARRSANLFGYQDIVIDADAHIKLLDNK